MHYEAEAFVVTDPGKRDWLPIRKGNVASPEYANDEHPVREFIFAHDAKWYTRGVQFTQVRIVRVEDDGSRVVLDENAEEWKPVWLPQG